MYCPAITPGFNLQFGAKKRTGDNPGPKKTAKPADENGNPVHRKPRTLNDIGVLFGDGLEDYGGKEVLIDYFRTAPKKAINVRLPLINGRPTPLMRVVTSDIPLEEKLAILNELGSKKTKGADLAKIDFAVTWQGTCRDPKTGKHVLDKTHPDNGKTVFDFAFEQSPKLFLALAKCYLGKMAATPQARLNITEFKALIGIPLKTHLRLNPDKNVMHGIKLALYRNSEERFATNDNSLLLDPMPDQTLGANANRLLLMLGALHMINPNFAPTTMSRTTELLINARNDINDNTLLTLPTAFYKVVFRQVDETRERVYLIEPKLERLKIDFR